MNEVNDVDEANCINALLDEFHAALAAAKEKRAKLKPGARLHDVALAVGRMVVGKFAPLSVAAKKSVEWKRRGVPAPGEGRSAMASEWAAWGDSPATKMPRSSFAASTQESSRSSPHVASYAPVLAQATKAALVARARRHAERHAAYLPVPGKTVERVSFAPRVARPTAGEALHPEASRSMPAPGLRRGHFVQGAATVPEEMRHNPEMEPESRHLAARPALEHGATPPFDLKQALDEYFFRQSRLPPNGGAGFNPLLSPIWAGLKLPG